MGLGEAACEFLVIVLLGLAIGLVVRVVADVGESEGGAVVPEGVVVMIWGFGDVVVPSWSVGLRQLIRLEAISGEGELYSSDCGNDGVAVRYIVGTSEVTSGVFECEGGDN